MSEHSYGADPLNSPIDEVRLLIGDTDSLDWQLKDAEVAYYISLYGKGLPAAVQACLGLSAKYTRLADEVTGEVEVKFSQRARNYRALADDLDAKAKTSVAAIPFGGGTSAQDVAQREADGDRIPTQFSSGMMDNPGA